MLACSSSLFCASCFLVRSGCCLPGLNFKLWMRSFLNFKYYSWLGALFVAWFGSRTVICPFCNANHTLISLLCIQTDYQFLVSTNFCTFRIRILSLFCVRQFNSSGLIVTTLIWFLHLSVLSQSPVFNSSASASQFEPNFQALARFLSCNTIQTLLFFRGRLFFLSAINWVTLLQSQRFSGSECQTVHLFIDQSSF